MGTSIDLIHAKKSLDQSPVSYISESVLNILDSEQTKQKKIHGSLSNSKGEGDLPCLLFCHATYTLFIGVTPEFRVRGPHRSCSNDTVMSVDRGT